MGDRFVAAHTAQNYMPPDSLKSDPLDEQILSWHGLWRRWRLAGNLRMMGRATER